MAPTLPLNCIPIVMIVWLMLVNDSVGTFPQYLIGYVALQLIRKILDKETIFL